MKNIWNNIPAWIKAIILNLILLFPTLFLVQSTVSLNLQSGSSAAWGLLVIIPILIIYWLLVKKWNPFNGPDDVKLELTFKLGNKKSWYRMLALILIIVSFFQLFFIAFGVETTSQIEFFKQFRAYSPIVAVPLLLALALHAGIVEEVVYRAFMQNTLLKAYQKWLAFLIIGILFTISHFLPLPLVLAYLLVSIAFCMVADEFKSTGVVIVAHIVVDFLLFLNFYYEAIDLLDPKTVYIGIAGAIIGIFLLFKDRNLNLTSSKELSYQW